MGTIRQPMIVKEIVIYMNSLIEGTEYQCRLSKLKQQLRLDNHNNVGRKWYRLFMQRHGHRLVTKKGERYDCNRADWTKEPYLKQMYDVVYDNMVAY